MRIIIAAGIVALSALPVSAYTYEEYKEWPHNVFGASPQQPSGSPFDGDDGQMFGNIAMGCLFGAIGGGGLAGCGMGAGQALLEGVISSSLEPRHQSRHMRRQYAGRSRSPHGPRVAERRHQRTATRIVGFSEKQVDEIVERALARQEEALRQKYDFQERVPRRPLPRAAPSAPPAMSGPPDSEEIRPRFQTLAWVAPQPALFVDIAARESVIETSPPPIEKKAEKPAKPWYETTPEELKEILRSKKMAKQKFEPWYPPGHPKVNAAAPQAPAAPPAREIDTRLIHQAIARMR